MIFTTAAAHLIEFFIAYIFYSFVFRAKKKTLYILLVGFLLYSPALLLYFVFRSTVVNILAGTVFSFFFCKLFFVCKTKEAIFSALFLSAALMASEFISMSLFSTDTGNINSFLADINSFIVVAVFRSLLYLLMILPVGLVFRKTNIGKPPFFLFFFPIAAMVILYTLWLTASQAPRSPTVNLLMIAASFCVILSILLTYIFYGKTSRELTDLYNSLSENDRIKTDEAYYEILDRQNIQLKTLIHDEKNHLAAIKSLANNREVSEYIDAVFGQIEENSLFGNTKNKILDLIINKYQYICESEHIRFYVSIKTANLQQLDKPDLIALLGNLLDNAVDAAKQSKNKKIDLSINKANGFDVLTCVNSCDRVPSRVGDELETTKTDTASHGLGVKSMKRIVKKYKGNFEWRYDDAANEFAVHIVF